MCRCTFPGILEDANLEDMEACEWAATWGVESLDILSAANIRSTVLPEHQCSIVTSSNYLDMERMKNLTETVYKIQDHKIDQKEHVKDKGVIMSADLCQRTQ